MTVTTTELSALTGIWTIDPSHTRIGFFARHAMVTTVRGAFDDFDGTLVIDAANPRQQHRAGLDRRRERRHRQRPTATRTCAAPTSSTSRTFPTITFASTRGAGRTATTSCWSATSPSRTSPAPVEIAVETEGIATDPFGNIRAGFEGEATISRKDFGLTWNVALEAGGVLVSDKVKIQLDVVAVKQACPSTLGRRRGHARRPPRRPRSLRLPGPSSGASRTGSAAGVSQPGPQRAARSARARPISTYSSRVCASEGSPGP